MIATKVEENPKIPTEKFDVPKEIVSREIWSKEQEAKEEEIVLLTSPGLVLI
jgi:hypothetical protein